MRCRRAVVAKALLRASVWLPSPKVIAADTGGVLRDEMQRSAVEQRAAGVAVADPQPQRPGAGLGQRAGRRRSHRSAIDVDLPAATPIGCRVGVEEHDRAVRPRRPVHRPRRVRRRTRESRPKLTASRISGTALADEDRAAERRSTAARGAVPEPPGRHRHTGTSRPAREPAAERLVDHIAEGPPPTRRGSRARRWSASAATSRNGAQRGALPP